MSLLSSFISAIALLGLTSEMYRYGTMYSIALFSFPVSQTIAALVYVPMFHGLGITSAYEVSLYKNNSSILFIFSQFIIFKKVFRIKIQFYCSHRNFFNICITDGIYKIILIYIKVYDASDLSLTPIITICKIHTKFVSRNEPFQDWS